MSSTRTKTSQIQQGRKRPTFRATSTKMSYIPSKACQAQGRKRPRFSKDENVPHSEGGTKTSQIQQGRKRPTFRGRYENGPDSAIGKVRKRPKFHLARGNENVPILERKRSHFQTMMQQQLFWFLCDQVRFLGKYAKIFGENKNMRNYAENIELCGIVRRTGNCAKSHSPHLNVASDVTRNGKPSILSVNVTRNGKPGILSVNVTRNAQT